MTIPEYKKMVSAYLIEDAPFVSRSTTKAKSLIFKRLAQYMPARMDGITPSVITKWTAYLKEQGKSTATLMLHRTVIKSLFRWGIDRGMCDENPVKKIRSMVGKDSEREAITPEEYKRLLTCQYRPRKRNWYPFLIEVAWETGMRLGDICLLRWDQIDMDAKVLHVTPMKTRRLGKELFLPLDNLMPLLRMLRQQANRPSSDFTGDGDQKMSGTELVFPQAAYEYTMNQPEVSKGFRMIAQRAGVKKTFHCLRHSFVTELVRKNVTLPIIRSMTGQSLQVLERYCHPSMQMKRDAVCSK